MKTKKILGMLLALTMVFSMVIIPQAVVNATDYSDNVYLDYNFDDYTGGKTFGNSATGTNVTLAGLSQSQTNKLLLEVEEDGNKYLYSDVDTWLNANSGKTVSDWANAGFNLTFGESFPAEGTYAISFDLRMESEAKDTTRNFTIRHNDRSFYSFAGNTTKGYFFGYKLTSTLDENGEEGTPYAVTCGKKYRIDLVYDLDNNTFKSYVDGTLLADRAYTGVLAGQILRFNMEQEVSFFDNLKVAKITSTSFEADAEYANNTATISFTESLLTEETALDASDFTVTNAATGEAVAVATATKTAYDEVTLTFADGAIKKGFKYIITFGTDVKNIAGNAVSEAKEVSFTLPAEEKTAYTEEFADFNTGDIKVNDLTNKSHNNFHLLYNQAQIDADSVRFKEPQAVVDGETEAIRVIRSASTNVNSDMTVKLPHKIYFEGEVTLEYRVRVSENLPIFRPYLTGKSDMGYQLDAANTIPSIYYTDGEVRYVKATTTNQGTPVANKSGEIGTDWHIYKAVYHFDEETVDFYFDGDPLNTTPQTISNWDKMKAKGYFGYVDMRITGSEDAYVDIDYIKVTQTSTAPYVKGITYKDYQGNAAEATTAGIKEIAVSFGGNVSEASLENVKILDGEAEVTYEGTFDASTRTYTMTIPGLLAGGKAYTLDLAAVADPYGAAIVGENEYAITTGAGTKGDLTVTFSKAKADIVAGDKVTITATIIDTTGAAAENYALIGACYNGTALSDVDLATLTWNGCVGTAKANITVETDDIKAFVLESLSTLAPVSGSPFVLN